jgi:hypothetical protein
MGFAAQRAKWMTLLAGAARLAWRQVQRQAFFLYSQDCLKAKRIVQCY